MNPDPANDPGSADAIPVGTITVQIYRNREDADLYYHQASVESPEGISSVLIYRILDLVKKEIAIEAEALRVSEGVDLDEELRRSIEGES